MFGEREEGEDTFKKGSILQMYNRNKQKTPWGYSSIALHQV